MAIKSFLKRSGLLSVIKPPEVQRVEQAERFQQERIQVDSEKLRLENDKFEADLRYKQAIIDQKEQERRDKDRQHHEKMDHEKHLAVQKEKHDEKMLVKKQQHDEKLKEEERKNAIAIEEIKGKNTKEVITHESETRIEEKERSERFLDSESERKQIESQAHARDNALGEILKIMAKGAEDRKTLMLQAKLAKEGIGKDKIQKWIEETDEEEDKK